MILTFPWPFKELSPNRRTHWAAKSRKAALYKDMCWWICREKSVRFPIEADGLVLVIVFRPPSNRRADLDNMLASFKSGIDAISFYTTIDDSNFNLVISKGEPVKGGAVEVEIQPWRAIKTVRRAA